MNKKKVVVVNNVHGELTIEKEGIEAAGGELVLEYPQNEDEVIAATKDADVIAFIATPITARIINALEKCKLIIRYGVGYDNVDWKAAAERGIYVCNAQTYGTHDVGEHAAALLMAVSKLIPQNDALIRKDGWGCAGRGVRLYGKTVGFIGLGRIARVTCSVTNGLGMKAITYDPYVSQEILDEYQATSVDLETLLKESDFISVHAPLTEQSRHMLSTEQFKMMKNTAYVINTSRGALIDEEALIKALEDGEIAGAGLDVFEKEPIDADSRLRFMDNVVLVGHLAFNTNEAMVDLHKEVTADIVRVLNGERPVNVVNGL